MSGYETLAGPAYGPRQSASSRSWQARLAVALAVLVLLFTSHSLYLLFAEKVTEGPAVQSVSRDNPAYQALFLLQVGMVGILALFGLAQRRDIPALIWAFAFAAFVALSAIWSVNPSTTLTNAISLAFQVFAAWVVSLWLDPRAFLRVTFTVYAGVLAVSLFLLVVDPALVGTDRFGGGWLTDQEFSGVMASKNLAAYVFALVYIIALNGAVIGLHPVVRIAAGAGALLAIAMSNSATGVVVVLLATMAKPVLALAGRQRWALLYLGIVVATAAVVLMPLVNLGVSFGSLGRDASFTGRADLWRHALENIADRPVLGFGYNGFFDLGPFSPVWSMWSDFLYYFASTFHNSAVDMTVSLGVFGLAAFVGLSLRAGWVVFSPRASGEVALLMGLVLAAFVVGSAMEFAILHHNYVATFIAFYCFFAAGSVSRR